MESIEEVIIIRKITENRILLSSMKRSKNFSRLLILNILTIAANNVRIEDLFQPNMN